MTRDQAIEVIFRTSLKAATTDRANFLTSRSNVAGLIDALTALGLLDLETPEDAIQNSAVERLTGAHTSVHYALGTGLEVSAKLTASGAAEIIDVLTKSGFKITRT